MILDTTHLLSLAEDFFRKRDLVSKIVYGSESLQPHVYERVDRERDRAYKAFEDALRAVPMNDMPVLSEADLEEVRDHIYSWEMPIAASTVGGRTKRLTHVVGPATYRVYDGESPREYYEFRQAVEAYNGL